MYGNVSTLFLLMSILLTEKVGAQIETNFLPLTGGIRANLLTGMMHYIIELSRQGLIDGGVANLSVPDVDWNVGSDYVQAIVHTKVDSGNENLWNFLKIHSDIRQRTNSGITVKLLILIPGNYIIDVKLLGLIPLTWSGSFNLQFSSLEISGAGQLRGSFGRSPSIDISKPYVGVNGVSFTFDGFPGTSNTMNIIFIILSSLFVYTICIVILTIFSKAIRTRIILYFRPEKNYKSCDSVV